MSSSRVSESQLNASSADNSFELHSINKANRAPHMEDGTKKRYVVSIANEQLSDEEIVIKQWIHEYTANVDKVNDFYLSQLSNLMTRIDELKAEIHKEHVSYLLS